jgi:uncharacterized protein (DUF952 family)
LSSTCVNVSAAWAPATRAATSFPHLYGPLDLDAVTEVRPFREPFGADL